jgi:hypothetical protein
MNYRLRHCRHKISPLGQIADYNWKKPMVQIAILQVAINDLLEVRPPEPVRPFKPSLVDLNKRPQMPRRALAF